MEDIVNAQKVQQCLRQTVLRQTKLMEDVITAQRAQQFPRQTVLRQTQLMEDVITAPRAQSLWLMEDIITITLADDSFTFSSYKCQPDGTQMSPPSHLTGAEDLNTRPEGTPETTV